MGSGFQEYSKQRKAHEEEHAMAIATITKAKELLTQKRQALQQEESKVLCTLNFT